ncbi:MAG TPA: NAD(P)H-hydrate dehydratase, partial [Phnomibacter sp.]|nr:NAD(P)H-hydrate dehydratase [Phnomibacter sp.]
MNIYSSAQMKAWDSFTMQHEPIGSIDLMERAAEKVFNWISDHYPSHSSFICICGTGNNGGDGLAVARLLYQHSFGVRVFFCEFGSISPDCRENLSRLQALKLKVDIVKDAAQFPDVPPNAIIIDALFGTGLSRPVEGAMADVIRSVNGVPNEVISIDLPSGLPADSVAANDAVVHADHTLTFQVPKYSFFLPEHAHYVGQWHILDIGLLRSFEPLERTSYLYVDKGLIGFFKPGPRAVHAHKGLFGHGVLYGGSEGMMGAAIMAAKACLRSGIGLLTMGVSEWGMPIMQTAIPEAMCMDRSQWMNHLFYNGKTAVGVGMGWPQDDYHSKLLQWLISNVPTPLVLDATALNILATQPEWLTLRPAGSTTVITPHPGEFRRLAGASPSSADQLEKAKRFASQYQVFVVLKGAFTQVITPGGLVYFNSTGNPGMAKGGSGDVLAGLLTG